MTAWHGFQKIVGMAMLSALATIAGAASFEGDLSFDGKADATATAHGQTVVTQLEVVGESVLVAPAAETPLDVVEDAATADDHATVMESDRSYGCSSCGHDPGGLASRPGAINRVLQDVRPRWEAQVDALMLWQGNIASRVLFVDQAGAPALDANQAQTPMSAGPRFGLLLNLDPIYSIEGNYFNVQSFAGQAVTPVGQYQENNLAGYFLGPIEQAEVATSAGIQSAEMNWRRRTCSPITWLAGFRWVEWNQQMTIVEAFNGGDAAFGSATGNDLYGGQVGMDMWLWNTKTSPIKVNGIGKAGIFYNQARQQTEFADTFGTSQSASAVADQTSFVGEIGVNASVRLTNWLSWRAGYSVFWLSAVATAPQQLSQTDLAASPPTALINTNGSVLLHGVTTGLEARW